ncbi:MAG TPA: KpsF/GutQ family sugar-phosphate isomerase [Elusimicrobiales bacterium]|nr:KpsF/GutQ family sugar-phosphate isomerase [Elusimicrobiales bacterium]
MNARDAQILKAARGVIEAESRAVGGLRKTLDAAFVKAVRLIESRTGKAVLLGIGKSGLIARKIAATLSSTGTRSVYLHPVESLHGDLGMIAADDVAIALSYSGETEETAKLVPLLKRQGLPVIAITNNPASRLARGADIVLRLHVSAEACPHGIVPTSSTTAMLALGDALAVSLMAINGFDKNRFARLHPGGNLGKLLNLKVGDLMRKGGSNPVVKESDTLAKALDAMTFTKAGAVSVTGAGGKLTGYFTDGDLRRCLRKGRAALEAPVSGLMTRGPLTVHPETMAMEAARLITEKQIDNLPVTDKRTGRPVGMIDERDLLKEGLL